MEAKNKVKDVAMFGDSIRENKQFKSGMNKIQILLNRDPLEMEEESESKDSFDPNALNDT